MSDVKTTNWSVMPGFAFSAGAGLGGGVYIFQFRNDDEKRIYYMGFAGLGLAGGPGGAAWSTARELIKKLAAQLAFKAAGAIKGAATDTYGMQGQTWTKLERINKPFSANDLHHSTGRVSVLGASVGKVGVYRCFISASDGVVSWTPLFASSAVEVVPQNFDIQIGAILGMWWNEFDTAA